MSFLLLSRFSINSLIDCLEPVKPRPFTESLVSIPKPSDCRKMISLYSIVALVLLLITSTKGFLPLTCTKFPRSRFSLPASLEDTDSSEPTFTPPRNLPSAAGIDYVPLATMLATKDFLAADQFTRDNLIRISGAEAAGRNFVYWTEVQKLPKRDLITMEKLWLESSNGQFGYSVQRRIWDSEKGNFDNFIRKVGWTITENETERKRKWFGNNEFIYDLEKAPKGHLPLTNALRGTQLLRQILAHPVWTEFDWKNYQNIPWE